LEKRDRERRREEKKPKSEAGGEGGQVPGGSTNSEDEYRLLESRQKNDAPRESNGIAMRKTCEKPRGRHLHKERTARGRVKRTDIIKYQGMSPILREGESWRSGKRERLIALEGEKRKKNEAEGKKLEGCDS